MPTALLSSEQYLALPDEFDKSGNGIKDELIGGEVVKMSPPSRVHDLIKNQINQAILIYLAANRQLKLRTLVAIGYEVSHRDTYVADVSVLKKDRLAGEDRIIRGAPDLAIEVVSPTDTASRLKSKVDAYLQNGAKTVWVVFPDSRSVMVHTPDSVRELKTDQKIEDELLPGFSAPVSAFFELV
jgi:Uma2 family endonuclease